MLPSPAGADYCPAVVVAGFLVMIISNQFDAIAVLFAPLIVEKSWLLLVSSNIWR